MLCEPRYPKFVAVEGESLDMGAFSVDQDLSGSVALVRIGTKETTYIEIASNVDTNDELTWNGTTLEVDLSHLSMALLPGPGRYLYQITIMTAGSKPLSGPHGEFHVRASLPDKE